MTLFVNVVGDSREDTLRHNSSQNSNIGGVYVGALVCKSL